MDIVIIDSGDELNIGVLLIKKPSSTLFRCEKVWGPQGVCPWLKELFILTM